jgi:hypothetical protein
VILREGALTEADVHEILERGMRWWRAQRSPRA